MYIRKIFCILITVLLLSSISVPAGAAQEPIQVTINDIPAEFEVAPVISGGSTLVPLRAIFEAFGASVDWDNKNKKVTGIKGNTKIELQIGNKTAYVDGKPVNLDVPGTIVNGSTMVPARFISESFGAEITWTGSTRTVSITYEFKPEGIISEKTGDVDYMICTNRNIDTFLIAAALYYDFNNPYILPNTDQKELYKKAKEYFSPYKDHEFILNFFQYVSGKDVKSNIFGLLLSCSELPELKQVYNFPDYSYIGNTQEFLEQLKKFYADTNAEEFFKQNSKFYESLKSTIVSQISGSEPEELIRAMEEYTGNRQKYYPGEKIKYKTIISFYRNIGSFASLKFGNNDVLASIQFPYKYSNGNDEIDYDNILGTSVHEFLHSYINTPVSSNNQLISSLSQSKNKSDYISQFYVDKGFPWNRISDENIVRAVEARIFKSIFGESEAMTRIINPETRNGFRKVGTLYNKLNDYEQNRSSYPMLDDFTPELLKEFFK
ncbi:MAG TPA: stalk domain-containing protein [Clostridia bacterium]|nr:stalk domain-containing protein [Clostridia bacterium]